MANMENGDRPITIDVVIPVYNGEQFILRAINSVVSQTYSPEKIVVVDDGSTDGTERLVTFLKVKIPILFIKKGNGGPNSARNLGISHCTSDFVAFLDADDEWLENKLSLQVGAIRESNFEKLGAVYCGCELVDKSGDHIGSLSINRKLRGWIYAELLECNMIISSASGILIRNECFDKVGLFDEALRAGEDWDMWLRIAEAYQFDYVSAEIVKIRRHKNSAQNDKLFMFENLIFFYNKWATRVPLESKAHNKWRWTILREIVLELPDVQRIRLINAKMKKEIRRVIFPFGRGSLSLYFIIISPWILFIFITRILYRISLLLQRQSIEA